MRHLFWSGVASLRTDGIAQTARRVRASLVGGGELRYWILEELFNEEELEAQRKEESDEGIRFSIAVPLYESDGDCTREMIESVLAQTYGGWELCILDADGEGGSGREKICREYADADSRIKYKSAEKDRSISAGWNEALAMAEGEYVTLLGHNDLLHPAALRESLRAIREGADFIYTDEAVFESPDRGKILEALYKPDFGPDSLNGNNFIGHLVTFKRSLLEKTGGFRSEYDGSHEHDLFLRLTAAAEQIAHIPEVLYYRRGHSGRDAEPLPDEAHAIAAGAGAVEESLRVKGLEACVSPNGDYGYYYRIRYPLKGRPKISILIPNYEHLDDLRKCVESVLKRSTYDNYEIIIIENNSRSGKLFDYYEKISSEHDNIKIIEWEGKFNYSAINNYGVREAAEGEYLLLLNNDTEVITPGWIEEMLMYVQREDVGAAGAKLYYPDGTIQHAGVVLGLGSAAGHVSMRSPGESAGYMGRNIYAQNLSAVTAACMMIGRDVWEEAGGLDEEFAVAYNDVDLCLKIREAGYLIVWTPFAELYHFESKSRGMNMSNEQLKTYAREVRMLRERWSDFLEKGDPYYNPNFTLERPDYTPKTHMKWRNSTGRTGRR